MWLSVHPELCARRIVARSRPSETSDIIDSGKHSEEIGDTETTIAAAGDALHHRWVKTCEDIEQMRTQYHPLHKHESIGAEWTMHVDEDDDEEGVCAHLVRFIDGVFRSDGSFFGFTSFE